MVTYIIQFCYIYLVESMFRYILKTFSMVPLILKHLWVCYDLFVHWLCLLVDGDVKPAVAVTPSKAKQFLASLKRPKRNLWDRSRPDVQQWIQQFMYMGFDEARLVTDLAYWMDHYQSSDPGRQHHSPMGPRSAASYRHGANVNYYY
uniref:ECRG4 augurin precursor a n=1 Tax=Sinocyclocheilus rhinocerous TaxID=307959 RepID=A0A673KG81_9TELE